MTDQTALPGIDDADVAVAAPKTVRRAIEDGAIRVALKRAEGEPTTLIIAVPWDDVGAPSAKFTESGGTRGMLKHVTTGYRTVELPDGQVITFNLMAGVPAASVPKPASD